MSHCQAGTHCAPSSLIPPAYYADLACERGRFYLNDLLNLADEHTSVAGSATGSLTREQEQKRVFDQAVLAWGNGIHESLKESMFYI
jgi:eukaryotic translation initiation factor 2C